MFLAAVRSASLGSSEQGIHHILNESSCPSGQDARRLCVAVVSPADHVTNLNQSSPGRHYIMLHDLKTCLPSPSSSTPEPLIAETILTCMTGSF